MAMKGCKLPQRPKKRAEIFHRTLLGARYISTLHQWRNHHLGLNRRLCCSVTENHNIGLLSLDEVKKILNDVKADDIRIYTAKDRCNWTDFMVVVTGRSAWHVRNIGQALIYQAKQKQRGSQKMVLPSVEGEKEGKWIVIDSGTIVIHALDEKARAYYNLERLWESEISSDEQNQDLGEAFVKVRRINNSKKPAQTSG